jgi:hypothetical protein
VDVPQRAVAALVRCPGQQVERIAIAEQRGVEALALRVVRAGRAVDERGQFSARRVGAVATGERRGVERGGIRDIFDRDDPVRWERALRLPAKPRPALALRGTSIAVTRRRRIAMSRHTSADSTRTRNEITTQAAAPWSRFEIDLKIRSVEMSNRTDGRPRSSAGGGFASSTTACRRPRRDRSSAGD